MSGGGERITVASLLAGEGAQVVKSEDGQVNKIDKIDKMGWWDLN